MEEKHAHQKEWLTIPVLPCVSIEETLSFWELLGFQITYKQTRPYQYGVVERGDYTLHFVRIKGMEATRNLYNGCLVMVSDVGKVYSEFTQKLKDHLGRVPHSGLPRISRMQPGTTRFMLTDVSGNSVIFINYGEEDQKTWEKADDKTQSPLKKAIATAIRFRDYKNDERAAAATLDVALRKAENEASINIAEALLLRIDLATYRNEPLRADECKRLLHALDIPEEELKYLKEKYNVELPPPSV